LAAERPGYLLPVIVAAQFAGTSLWFAGNAVLPALQAALGLGSDMLGPLTSAVQFGFIAGTFVFALLALADRWPARLLFLGCSLAGALANLWPVLLPVAGQGLLMSRFATGFFLAGIYPVGMKIAASWYASGLGRAIGYLVGALVLGTAFPHLLRALGGELSWQMVLLWISVVAAAGGCLLALLVPDGPHLPKSGPFRARGSVDIFAGRAFRAAAFGYFGHMWELYAFWAFVPVIWEIHATCRRMVLDLPLYSFAVIAVGFLGCAGGGLISLRLGSARVAAAQLTVSGACCLLSPLAFGWPTPVFVAFMLVWGITVIGDSPQFSALTAATAPRQLVGTALTTVTCIGFSLTIVSIQLLHFLHGILPDRLLILPLAAGPAAGLLALRRLLRP